MWLSWRLTELRGVLAMSKLAALLDELCPDGVEYRPLGEVVKIRNGQDWKSQEPGEIPVYGSGGRMKQTVAIASSEGPSVLLPRKGSLEVQYVNEPIWNVDTVFTTRCDARFLNTRFFYFAMKSIDLGRISTSATRPSLTQSALRKLLIPVPPLEVQQEIVRVLDAFTDLEQSLVSELELRKKQYVEYRDTAIEDLVNGNAPSVNLGDHARTVNGLTGKNKSDFSDGNAKFITYRNVFSNPEVDLEINDYVKVAGGEKQNQVELGDVIFTGSSESREEVGFSAVVTRTPAEPIYLNSFCFMVRFEDPEFIDPGFAKHMFRSRPIRKQIMKAANGVTRINISKPRFMRVEIPVPPMEMQQEIAVKLDAFSSLIQSIEQEISLRRTQYEFYRDELLSFAPQED